MTKCPPNLNGISCVPSLLQHATHLFAQKSHLAQSHLAQKSLSNRRSSRAFPGRVSVHTPKCTLLGRPDCILGQASHAGTRCAARTEMPRCDVCFDRGSTYLHTLLLPLAVRNKQRRHMNLITSCYEPAFPLCAVSDNNEALVYRLPGGVPYSSLHF